MTTETAAPPAGSRRHILLAFSIGGLFHVLAAVFVTGFFHADQHFQTLEWALAKTRPAEEVTLAWEHDARIRPWTQPYIYAGVLRVFDAVGVEAPLARDRILRLLTAALGLTALVLLALAVARHVPDPQRGKWLALALGLFWFFPFFNTRTAGETLAAAFLGLGLASLWLMTPRREDAAAVTKGSEAFRAPENNPARALVVSGVFLGLAFNVRYQMGIAVASLLLWYAVGRRLPLPRLLLWGAIFGVVVMMGIVVDSVGYGAATLAPWNYLVSNLVEGKAASYGVEPWYYYLTSLAVAPLGVVLIAAAILFWARHPRSVFTWLTLPFILIHVLLSHKELRFLTPLAPLVVTMAVLVIPGAWFASGPGGNPFLRRGPAIRWAFWLFATINAVALVAASLRPLRPDMAFQAFVLRNFPERFEFYGIAQSPYLWGPDRLPLTFYRPREVVFHPVASVAELEHHAATGASIFLYHDQNAVPDAPEWDWVRTNCRLRYQAFPRFVQRFNATDWLGRTSANSLYECRSPSPSAAFQ